MAAGYKHRIETSESENQIITPAEALSGLQVVIGTAPINKADDPASLVNVPIMANSAAEAKEIFGYSDDFESYTLCPSMDLMEDLGISPVVFVNVLDPTKHKKENSEKSISVTNLKAVYDVADVILSTMVVKNDTATLTNGSDYIVDYEGQYPVITLLSSGTAAEATSLKVTSQSIDPSTVTKTDIVGGYNIETGEASGIECVRDVFSETNNVPGIIIAPGWSQDKDVAAALQLKTEDLNSAFQLITAIDIDTTKAKSYAAAKTQKDAQGIDDDDAVALWPMVVYKGKTVYYSAVWAAMAALCDADHGDIPYKSPSNETPVPITGTCLKDGTRVRIDLEQAEFLNGDGIITIINFNGWRTWGNNTAAYPEVTTMKDRWVACKRMMNWYRNRLVLEYLDRVDEPNNPRQVENLVDSENLYLNGLVGAGTIAGGTVSYDQEANPIEDVLEGWQTFDVALAFWPPNEYILFRVRFNADLIRASYEAAMTA